MGCDIHMNVEVRRGGRWQFVPPPTPCGVDDCWISAMHGWEHRPHWWGDRNYTVFSALAGVRADDYDPAPISEPRGYPQDVDPVTAFDPPYEEHHPGDLGQNHGDHSHTWLRLDEVLRHSWSKEYYEHGAVTIEEFARCTTNKVTPQSWCRHVGGRDTVVMPATEAKRWLKTGKGKLHMLNSLVNGSDGLVYVDMKWKVTLEEQCAGFLEWARNLPKKLDAKPECIRLVFSFDS